MFVLGAGLSNRPEHEINPIRAEGLDQRGKHSEEMMSMSNKHTHSSAHRTGAGAPKSTNAALADFPGAPVTLPKTQAHVAVERVVRRDMHVGLKFLGMKADHIRRFTFV